MTIDLIKGISNSLESKLTVQAITVFNIFNEWSLLYGEQIASELIETVKKAVETDKKMNAFFGVGIVEELIKTKEGTE